MVKKVARNKEEKQNLQSRPPVVAVLGHVDHGKTTLLDHIRKTNVAEKEPGLITQKIGAYQVEVEVGGEKKKITFIDTPGHEAFAKMRQRGAQITDLAVLVVASDDGVMPQTKEAIKYLKESQTPFMVALNKIDLPTANLQKVKKQLADEGVLAEELGGKVVCLPISAKTGRGIKELLEMIVLLAEMEGLEANLPGPLKLAVIEAKLDSRKGPLATVIVQNGTLRVGEIIEVGGLVSKVRGMFNERGEKLSEATPSTPVEILGLSQLPQIGEIAHEKGQLPKELAETEKIAKLKIILKADVFGSLEAVLHALPPEVKILSQGVGEINESDILLAKTSGAVVLGFNLKPSSTVQKLAETEEVVVRTYEIIYELLKEIKEVVASQKILAAEKPILGKAKILSQFPFNKEKVAGCQVIEGRICRGDTIKVLRGEEEIGQAKIKSLRRLKEDITKAEMGLECGVLLSPGLDFSPGDVIIAYKI